MEAEKPLKSRHNLKQLIMKKLSLNFLELDKQTIALLDANQLRDVVGGANNTNPSSSSTTTGGGSTGCGSGSSQCRTA